MDRFHGKPNSQFLSSSGKKEESQYSRQMNQSVSVTAHLRSLFSLIPFNMSVRFLLSFLFKNIYLNINISIMNNGILNSFEEGRTPFDE